MKDPTSFTYDLAQWIFNILISLFFREVRPRGAYKIPKQGPVIFVVGPHASQFVDPILLMRECGRRVSFLIAEKSMHQKGIGTFARMIHAIPVIRPQDLAVAGKGRLQLLDRKSEPLRITGVDTAFLSQLRPRDSIVLPKGIAKAEVVQVISNTELIIKKEFKELKALELLTNNEGTAYKCMPHVDQEKVYKAVHEELNNGGCITIFPEGGSHDRAELLPLKVGVSLMALGAMTQFPNLDVKIVPVGLNYFHAHRFRSRAVIEFGSPISVSPALVEKYKQGAEEKREACNKLLDTIHGALKSVTVNAGSYETLMLIQAARRLYKPAHRKLHISQVVDLNRRFAIGYNIFKDDPKVIELEKRTLAYNQLLQYHGIRDHQVSKTNLGGLRAIFLLFRRLFALLILALAGLPGAVLNLPVMVIAKVISQKKAAAALKASTVKIAGRDVLATWKLLVGLVVIPTLYCFYASLVFAALSQVTDMLLKSKLMIAFGSIAVISFMSYMSLKLGEIGVDIAKSLRPLLMSVLNPAAAESLRHSRSQLSRDLTDLINEYGPQVFPDFDADYISRTTPKSTSSSTSVSGTPRGSQDQLSGSRFPRIRSSFLQQVASMEWLDDTTIFNWGSSKGANADMLKDLSMSSANNSGASSGWTSEVGTPSYDLSRSRSGSFDSESVMDDLSMTHLKPRSSSGLTTPAINIESMDTVTDPLLQKKMA
ncbi:uncharacterized protein BYT42DRAFT_562373 [Radiomyces spectabilis]|uniref:uncharacterized protein n=1 Tax=Radiomyces spectabilis TaxID=64574 RepID=UPI00222003B9|nr:uncharacterized protein BYT42DRAFT_562373 [Radiomyces spectabilis]KAI8384391.1 hypothetical protein BYT42DRAFT_562373 [Radiomyces spectabilis]